MDLPSILDIDKMAAISAVTIAIIQYVKASIPEKLIPLASMVAGIGVSLLFFYKGGVEIDWIVVVANGALATALSDTVYSMLSNTSSPTLTLPSKSQIVNGKNNKVSTPNSTVTKIQIEKGDV